LPYFQESSRLPQMEQEEEEEEEEVETLIVAPKAEDGVLSE
jgi:hypothetical protein